MFLLLRGVVSVVLNRSGGPETVARLREGDCFGEMSLLTGQPRSATVVADEDCEALVIGKAAVGDLLESEPKLAEQLSLLLAERRLANEAKVSREGDASTPASQQKLGDYARSFLRQVSTFFEL
jgi:CRP-like cAMP-binding protein